MWAILYHGVLGEWEAYTGTFEEAKAYGVVNAEATGRRGVAAVLPMLSEDFVRETLGESIEEGTESLLPIRDKHLHWNPAASDVYMCGLFTLQELHSVSAWVLNKKLTEAQGNQLLQEFNDEGGDDETFEG
jgi:hypothetical protein